MSSDTSLVNVLLALADSMLQLDATVKELARKTESKLSQIEKRLCVVEQRQDEVVRTTMRATHFDAAAAKPMPSVEPPSTKSSRRLEEALHDIAMKISLFRDRRELHKNMASETSSHLTNDEDQSEATIQTPEAGKRVEPKAPFTFTTESAPTALELRTPPHQMHCSTKYRQLNNFHSAPGSESPGPRYTPPPKAHSSDMNELLQRLSKEPPSSSLPSTTRFHVSPQGFGTIDTEHVLLSSALKDDHTHRSVASSSLHASVLPGAAVKHLSHVTKSDAMKSWLANTSGAATGPSQTNSSYSNVSSETPLYQEP